MSKAVIITGGTGMVGQSLTNYFISKGFNVHVLTRTPNAQFDENGIYHFHWDTQKQTYDAKVLNNAVGIVNLAGAGIAGKRWTSKRKKEIVDSRVAAGNLVEKMLLTEQHHIQTLIQASAIGWYAPNASKASYQEDLPPNTDFLGAACAAWEDSVKAIDASKGIRKVIIRIGIVLNENGGYVKAQMLPLKMGVAPIFGNGKQMVSWIHQQDLNQIIGYCINNPNINGVYNAVATDVINQKTLITKIAEILKNKIWLKMPAPSFLLKIALGEMSIELLKSSHISNQKILDAGYAFTYPNVENIKSL